MITINKALPYRSGTLFTTMRGSLLLYQKKARMFQRVWFIVSAGLIVLTAGYVVIINKQAPHKMQSVSVVKPDDKKLVEGRSAESEKLADSIIAYAKTLLGTPYYYTGRCQATGFDCSGFTSHVYGHFGINVSPASKEQIFAGRQIPIKEASKADLLIFTGTNISVREPGHVGIVISEKGKPIRFIHSSSSKSAYGVTISQVDSTKYALRLLQVRRVVE